MDHRGAQVKLFLKSLSVCFGTDISSAHFMAFTDREKGE